MAENYCFEEVADSGGEVGFRALSRRARIRSSFTASCSRAGRAIRGPGRLARSGSCRSSRPRVHRARQSSTRSMAPLTHLDQQINLAVVAKSDPERVRTFAGSVGGETCASFPLSNNTYNRDHHAETGEGEQIPILNVFVRDGDQVRHAWAPSSCSRRDEGEDPRHVDAIWPIWSVLDMTPGGRRTGSDFPSCTTSRPRSPRRRAQACQPRSGSAEAVDRNR